MNFLCQNVFLVLILIYPIILFALKVKDCYVVEPESQNTKKRVNIPESSQSPVDVGMCAP